MLALNNSSIAVGSLFRVVGGFNPITGFETSPAFGWTANSFELDLPGHEGHATDVTDDGIVPGCVPREGGIGRVSGRVPWLYLAEWYASHSFRKRKKRCRYLSLYMNISPSGPISAMVARLDRILQRQGKSHSSSRWQLARSTRLRILIERRAGRRRDQCFRALEA